MQNQPLASSAMGAWGTVMAASQKGWNHLPGTLLVIP